MCNVIVFTEAVDQVGHVRGLGLDNLQILILLLRRNQSVPNGVHVSPDHRDRRLHVVGNSCKHLMAFFLKCFALRLLPLNSAIHVLETGDHLLEFGDLSALRCDPVHALPVHVLPAIADGVLQFLKRYFQLAHHVQSHQHNGQNYGYDKDDQAGQKDQIKQLCVLRRHTFRMNQHRSLRTLLGGKTIFGKADSPAVFIIDVAVVDEVQFLLRQFLSFNGKGGIFDVPLRIQNRHPQQFRIILFRIPFILQQHGSAAGDSILASDLFDGIVFILIHFGNEIQGFFRILCLNIFIAAIDHPGIFVQYLNVPTFAKDLLCRNFVVFFRLQLFQIIVNPIAFGFPIRQIDGDQCVYAD